MKKYVCDVCGYVYDEAAGDPEHNIAPGTKFEDLPEDWVCPICGVGKGLSHKSGSLFFVLSPFQGDTAEGNRRDRLAVS